MREMSPLESGIKSEGPKVGGTFLKNRSEQKLWKMIPTVILLSKNVIVFGRMTYIQTDKTQTKAHVDVSTLIHSQLILNSATSSFLSDFPDSHFWIAT